MINITRYLPSLSVLNIKGMIKEVIIIGIKIMNHDQSSSLKPSTYFLGTLCNVYPGLLERWLKCVFLYWSFSWPGGKPNTPSHPVTAGHVADGQRGSGIGLGALLAVLVMDTSWQYCRVLGIQDQRVARVWMELQYFALAGTIGPSDLVPMFCIIHPPAPWPR